MTILPRPVCRTKNCLEQNLIQIILSIPGIRFLCPIYFVTVTIGFKSIWNQKVNLNPHTTKLYSVLISIITGPVLFL